MLKALPWTAMLIACSPCFGTIIDVTEHEFAEIYTGQRLAINFGVWNYGVNNAGFSAVPTGFNFQAVGLLPDTFHADLIPSSSTSYVPGYLFDGWVSSADGSVSFPLLDSNAAALGLGAGSLVATIGTVSIGGADHQALLLSGSVCLTQQQANQLFGSGIDSYDHAATVWLYNRGSAFEVTLGSQHTVQNAVGISGVQGAGPAQTGGIPGIVTLYNPEPSTILLAGGALTLLWGWRRRAPTDR